MPPRVGCTEPSEARCCSWRLPPGTAPTTVPVDAPPPPPGVDCATTDPRCEAGEAGLACETAPRALTPASGLVSCVSADEAVGVGAWSTARRRGRCGATARSSGEVRVASRRRPGADV